MKRGTVFWGGGVMAAAGWTHKCPALGNFLKALYINFPCAGWDHKCHSVQGLPSGLLPMWSEQTD